VNLPNTISALRIAATPFLLVLPFAPSAAVRLAAFLLFVVTGLSDYWDGVIARSRALITDLGRMLDPLADKFFLLATILPAYVLMLPPAHWAARAFTIESTSYPFLTPLGYFNLPFWVVAIVVGREVLMTLFRVLAARRGVVISAVSAAKLKTTLQSIWLGGAYFWFFVATLAAERNWTGAAWYTAANVIGVIGVLAMTGAVALTLYSLGVYLRRYGSVLARQTAAR
jgi:CDP-diacylglycerol---glycerol-3-phosphate 3-phosphatidyltransferase